MNIKIEPKPRFLALAAIYIFYGNKYLTWYYFKKLLMKLPQVNDKLLSTSLSLQTSLETPYKNMEQLPVTGLSLREVLEKTECVRDKENESKQTSGIIYTKNEHHLNNLAAVFRKYASSNPLHPDIFPEIREMEIDIVNMTRRMFKGDENVCGNVTSGGTESILLAVYTYREWGRKEHGITNPNIVAFESVHPAFEKACHYFGITLRKVSSPLWYKLRIDWNTICCVLSAPTYAYGVIDPYHDLTQHCLFRNVPVHIDCCMGGFLIPFLQGNSINFENKGITSISADSHKYGNCVKGSSILLFRSWEYKKHQHFIKTNWEGGMYATPTLLGSKSGAIIATTWASMLLTGESKFTTIARSIKYYVDLIKEEFKENETIEIIGQPTVNIVAFRSKCENVDIYRIVQNMKDWNLTVLTNPKAFHLCITSVHTKDIIEKFIKDLKQSIRDVEANPEEELEGTLAIYGSSTKIENSFFTNEIVNQFVGLLSSKNIFKFNC